jgi:hypothetical protein
MALARTKIYDTSVAICRGRRIDARYAACHDTPIDVLARIGKAAHKRVLERTGSVKQLLGSPSYSTQFLQQATRENG